MYKRQGVEIAGGQGKRIHRRRVENGRLVDEAGLLARRGEFGQNGVQIIFGMGRFVSVSYTHLDVYKRQRLAGWVALPVLTDI